MHNAYNTVTLWFNASFKHFVLLETRWHRPTNQPTDRQTDRPTDIATYRAAIAAKNKMTVCHNCEHIFSCDSSSIRGNVCLSVGQSVGVNEFQEVLIALKGHVLIMFKCILWYVHVYCILCTIYIMHNDILTAIVALYLTMSVCWSVGVNLFRGVLNNFISHSTRVLWGVETRIFAGTPFGQDDS